jgi:hypothetical protein
VDQKKNGSDFLNPIHHQASLLVKAAFPHIKFIDVLVTPVKAGTEVLGFALSSLQVGLFFGFLDGLKPAL